MLFRRCIPVCAIALAACLSPLAQATTLALPTDGSWTAILMDDGLAPNTREWVSLNDDGVSYTAVRYAVTIAAGFQGLLTVVDTGFSGDRIAVTDALSGQIFGRIHMPSMPVVDDQQLTYVDDADAALADAGFSRAVFNLSAGNHVLSGWLLDGGVYGSTSGALKLEVSAVPEPATVLSLLAGLGLIGATLRRRAR